MTLTGQLEDTWDALVDLVITIADFGNRVYYSEKNVVDTFPAVVVCPGDISFAPATMHESYWRPLFEIGVVVSNDDTKEGMIAAGTYCEQIIDLLHADRTLGGIIQNLEVQKVEPYWRNMGRGTERHWMGITLLCEKKIM